MNATRWFILVVLVAGGLWDMAALVSGWMPTISATIRTWAATFPLLPFLLAILAVVLFFHLFMW
jgi:hypothetical protein